MTLCKQTAGTLIPVIDRNRCEGKGPSIAVCPYQVLGMHILPRAQRQGLSVKGRLKGFVHRWQQAEVIAPERCMACGLCVSACPEQAISLSRNASA